LILDSYKECNPYLWALHPRLESCQNFIFEFALMDLTQDHITVQNIENTSTIDFEINPQPYSDMMKLKLLALRMDCPVCIPSIEEAIEFENTSSYDGRSDFYTIMKLHHKAKTINISDFSPK